MNRSETPPGRVTGPHRRHLLAAGFGAAGLVAAGSAQGAMMRDVREFGVMPDAPIDQAPLLEAALREAARIGHALHLPAGRYRIAEARLPDGAMLTGSPAAVIEQIAQAPVLVARNIARLRLAGFALAGENGRDVPLIALEDVVDCRIEGLVIDHAAATAIELRGCGGLVAQCRISDARTAIFATDSTGLAVTGNILRDCTDNGILVWRAQKGHDGTQVLANRIERIGAASGGSGEYGNGVNSFRADGVIVADNVIRDCTFSAVRNNAGDDVQIIGNNCAAMGEVGLFTEFGFAGCIIANNIVDGAANGIVSTNFNESGRLSVISGNIVRGTFRRPDPLTGQILYGHGIFAEADAAVTGNLVEDTESGAIGLGYGPYLRDVSASGNVLRDCACGFAVSVVEGAGRVQIAGNLISGAREGAILGFRWTERASDDLIDGAGDFPHIALSGNVSH